MPVVGLATAEGAGLGAALQAAYVVLKESGNGQSIAELAEKLVAVDPTSRAEPNAANHALYASQLDRQMALTKALAAAGYL